MTAADHDIVIVGAGLVGLTLACALQEGPWDIAIVEAGEAEEADEDGSEAPFDVRVSAVSRASERVFAALGVWREMEALRVTPFREMHVWDANGRGSIHFDSADIGEERLGCIVENRVMRGALSRRLSSGRRLTWYRPAQVHALELRDNHWDVSLDTGETIRGRLVVGADGVDSRVRLLAGLRATGWRYEQRALVANVQTSRSHGDTAWQVFLPTGPLAFLPMPENYSAIVWSTTPAEAQRLASLDADAFLADLQLAFGARLGRMLSTGPRATFPLRMLHAKSYVAPRAALVGDAAHTIHPLAGQGLNLGLLDAAVLAELLLGEGSEGRDPGALHTLRRYERWRKGDNMVMLAALEGFHRLFGSRTLLVTHLRNWGLTLTDLAGPLKNMIMRHATGLTGDLPRLARASNV